MKVVEHLAEHYRVALLNSKNSWRILGQESMPMKSPSGSTGIWRAGLFVPVGNAGNITAVMSGLLKMRRLGIISICRACSGCSPNTPTRCGVITASPRPNACTIRDRPPERGAGSHDRQPGVLPRVKALVDAYEAAGGESAWFR